MDLKDTRDAVRRELFSNILISMKLSTLIKMCLSERYSKDCIGKHLSSNFTVQNCLKQGHAL
jgi:hypothetical protein